MPDIIAMLPLILHDAIIAVTLPYYADAMPFACHIAFRHCYAMPIDAAAIFFFGA